MTFLLKNQKGTKFSEKKESRAFGFWISSTIHFMRNAKVRIVAPSTCHGHERLSFVIIRSLNVEEFSVSPFPNKQGHWTSNAKCNRDDVDDEHGLYVRLHVGQDLNQYV